MIWGPLSVFVSTFSLGAKVASAEALLKRLPAEVHSLDTLFADAQVANRPAAVGGAPDEAWLGEAVVAYPRLMELATQPAWGLVTDSPNVMVRVRRLARAAGVATVPIGCAYHAINLLSKDCANVDPFAESLRDVTRVAVFFKRCGSGRAALSGALEDFHALGRGVADLATFSESRWCGIYLTVE